MKTTKFVSILTVSMLCALPVVAMAQEKATAAQASAMVKKGVAYVKSAGKDKAYAEITAKDAKFIDHDLYLVVLVKT